MEGFYVDCYDSDGGESWDATPVTFLRPDGDTEGKDVQWCLDNEFFEIEEAVWSGEWYYRSHPEERQFHAQRLRRTREIKRRGEQKKARVRAQREAEGGYMGAHDAAFLSVLMGDIARQTGMRMEDLFPAEGGFVGPLGSNLNAPPTPGRTIDYANPNHGQPRYSKSGKKTQRYEKPYEKGSEEAIATRKHIILRNVILWADGDQGLVDRTRAAFQESDDRPYKCPACGSWFPTEETALLHAQNASGKAHNRWRRANGYKTKSLDDFKKYTHKCVCCSVLFPSRELADFHLKNDPDSKHRKYRIRNGMAEEWDHNIRERFRCPVCSVWFFTPEKIEEHVQTQKGKAHKCYRREQQQQQKAEFARQDA